MDVKEFSLKMKDALQGYYGETVTVSLNEVTKNNGVRLQGISIMEKDRNISPTIYLNSIFEEYEEGTTFAACVRKITNVYEDSRTETNINMDFFTDYGKVKEKLVYKLINFEKNQELLAQIPHITYLDLAIVFYCLVSHELIGNATVLIHHKHCKIWGITQEELYRQAGINTPRLLPYEIQNMEDVLRTILIDSLRREYAGVEAREYDNEESCQEPSEEWFEQVADQMMGEVAGEERAPMYVLSNQSRILGAACILYQNLMEKFAEEVGKDFYVLPSSVHELILVPALENVKTPNLSSMVEEVNQTQLEEEEVLANHAYYYSRATGKLSVV